MLSMPAVPHVPDLAGAAIGWYDVHQRDLPWRSAAATPWAVLVSEIMLQQTPVARVLPAYEAWMARWPTPAALAAAQPGEAVRAWGRLGYPRRALRLHECAVAITGRHGGNVPSDLADLLALPGVGAYTGRAVASFAFGQRHAVVDTNVRRVLTRVVTGEGDTGPSTAARDNGLAEPLLPAEPAVAARFGVAVMELGALVCTARAPRCADCPLAHACAWRLAGKPEYRGPTRRPQGYAGTDRQVRGLLLAVLREADGPVPRAALDAVWRDPLQRGRALDSLIADGLVDVLGDDTFALPT